MEVRRRKAAADDCLSQPLLQADVDDSSSSRGQEEAYAIVPHSINRYDWEALIAAFANACKSGWSGVLTTISNCIGSLFSQHRPRQLQPMNLSLEEERRLQLLHKRVQQPYDAENSSQQELLRLLWSHAFPGERCNSLVDARWMEMGWQQRDPSTDFRGAGLIALENLVYLAQRQPELFHRLLHKTDGDRSEWEYPFAAAGVNLTFMLEELLDLRNCIDFQPQTAAGRAFVPLLAVNADAFELVYAVAFETLDRLWLEMRASYMDFPAVMQRLRSQLNSALCSEPRSFEGLRALMTP